MSIFRLAFLNFKRSLSTYLTLILSLAFTSLILMNFQSVIYSDTFGALGEHNKEYVDILVQSISVVLICFMFFFIWYATNEFLNRRKKEIGIYVFMGLSNQKIGKMYAIETAFTGATALILGLGLGILCNGLFQMILLAMSDIAVEIHFQITWQPIAMTTVVFGVIYLLFVVKGYVSIVRSNVIDMIAARKKNEYVREHKALLIIKTILGLAVLFAGYYLAIKEGGMEVMQNVLMAVVLVIIGVYLLFGGFLPLVIQEITGKKWLLYKGSRTLWMNNVVFRMRKNYRTYAITCVMMLCAVTALATGFAMKNQYENIIQFRHEYSFQILSVRDDIEDTLSDLIQADNDITARSQADIVLAESSPVEGMTYGIISYSQAVGLAENAGLRLPDREPSEDEVIELNHIPLLSMITDVSNQTVAIGDKSYRQIEELREPYLGYLQESTSFYIVNDRVYEELLSLGEQVQIYNYKIADPGQYAESLDELDTLMDSEEWQIMGRIAVDPKDNDIEWIKVLYSLCIFMFLVFILASASILFMKVYNDAFEERERYSILRKIGCSGRILKKSISREVGMAYILPFAVMAISAYFSVHALEKMMTANLMPVYGGSVLIVLGFFLVFYLLSVFFYRRNVM